MKIFAKFKKEEKKIDNSLYGGFIVSKNVLYNNRKIKYTWREQSSLNNLNGWTIYSDIDDDNYVNNSNNFEIVSAETIHKFAPTILEIFDAPYGTDLCWLYENDTFIGFYDLKTNKKVDIKTILKGA